MNKYIIRTSLVTAAFLLIFTVSTNAFAVETAHRSGHGFYPPPQSPYHAPYHSGYGHGQYHHPPVPYYPGYHRGNCYGPRPIIVTPPGIYFRTPHSSIGVYF